MNECFQIESIDSLCFKIWDIAVYISLLHFQKFDILVLNVQNY